MSEDYPEAYNSMMEDYKANKQEAEDLAHHAMVTLTAALERATALTDNPMAKLHIAGHCAFTLAILETSYRMNIFRDAGCPIPLYEAFYVTIENLKADFLELNANTLKKAV